MRFRTAQDAFAFYAEAINLHDFDILQSRLMHPDICCRFDGIIHRGAAEVRRVFERAWDRLPDEVYRMSAHCWLVDSDVQAAVSFNYAYAGTDRQGQSVVGEGSGLNVFARTDKGWLLMLEDLVSLPPNRQE